MTTTVLTFVAVALVLAAPLGAREVVASPVPLAQLPRHGQEIRTPGDLCEGCNNGYYWTVDQWFTGNETYWAYCEPCRCPSCQGGWKPLAVTMYLFWEDENSCALSVSAEIVRADVSVPDCPTPGQVICASEPVTVGPFSPAGLWAVTVPLPVDAAVVTDAVLRLAPLPQHVRGAPRRRRRQGGMRSVHVLERLGTGSAGPLRLRLPGQRSASTRRSSARDRRRCSRPPGRPSRRCTSRRARSSRQDGEHGKAGCADAARLPRVRGLLLQDERDAVLSHDDGRGAGLDRDPLSLDHQAVERAVDPRCERERLVVRRDAEVSRGSAPRTRGSRGCRRASRPPGAPRSTRASRPSTPP